VSIAITGMTCFGLALDSEGRNATSLQISGEGSKAYTVNYDITTRTNMMYKAVSNMETTYTGPM
jgi:hypothetical protein